MEKKNNLPRLHTASHCPDLRQTQACVWVHVVLQDSVEVVSVGFRARQFTCRGSQAKCFPEALAGIGYSESVKWRAVERASKYTNKQKTPTS